VNKTRKLFTLRILPTSDIPTEIWQDNTLHMPASLASCYDLNLNKHSAMPIALDPQDPGGFVGGPTPQDTLQHFARRYGVGSCRIESLVIDPREAFQDIPDFVIAGLAGGDVAILDVACGCGAVGASLLSTIAVLRKNRKLPKLPLNVTVVGGDCSDLALQIYTDMMVDLVPVLDEVGINLNLIPVKWKAEASYTTAEMLDILMKKTTSKEEYFVYVANFSGALDKHYSSFRDSIHHIFDRTSNTNCTVLWVEPGNMPSAREVLKKIAKLLKEILPWSASSSNEPIEFNSYKWLHPFQLRTHPCRVLVQTFYTSKTE